MLIYKQMNFSTVLFLTILSVTVASLTCIPGFIPRPDLTGCLQACTHPDFANCPNLAFPSIWNPSFCGLKNDGSWQSFTYAC